MARVMTGGHGTYAGYQAHMRQGIPPCGPCRKANAEYARMYRANRSPEKKRRDSKKAAARSRALWRLADRHPAEFGIYLAEELDT